MTEKEFLETDARTVRMEKEEAQHRAKQKVEELLHKAIQDYADKQGITPNKVVEAYYCRNGQYGNELEVLCYAPIEEPPIPINQDLGFVLHNEDERKRPKAPKPTVWKVPTMSTEIVVKGSMARLMQSLEQAKEAKARSCCIRRTKLTQTWRTSDAEAMILSLRGDLLHGK